MRIFQVLTVCLLPLSTSVAQAQSTIKDSLVKHWKATGEFTTAVAKAMPAEDYKFKPVAEEMSFGQLILHIGVADINACSVASGAAMPEVPIEVRTALKGDGEVNKDAAVAFIGKAFDLCNSAVATMTGEKLDAVVGGQRKMTGFEWLWAYFTHTAHHRGQAEVYLRLKGIKPPQYTF